MLDHHKAIVRSLADLVQRGDLDRVDELFAPEYLPHDPSDPARQGGVDGARAFIAMLHAGMSDVRYTIDDLTAEADRVAYRWTLQGTHTGVFMGVPASGRTVTVTGMDMVRVVNDKIVESWAHADALGMLRQIGALPPLGPPSP